MKRAIEFQRLGKQRQQLSLSEFEIEMHFSLSQSELAQVLKRRRASNRLGLALQIGLLKTFGCHPSQSTAIQPEVLQFVARQIGISAPDIAGLRSIYPRSSTRYEHRKDAAQIAGFRSFGLGPQRALTAHLNLKVIASVSPSELLTIAREWLRSHCYIAPNKRVLSGLCRRIWQDRLELLALGIRSKVKTDSWIEALSAIRPSGQSVLEWLREGPRRRSKTAFEAELSKVRLLRDLGTSPLDLKGTPEAVIAMHARKITMRKPSEITRLHEPGRTVALACYFHKELQRRLDLAVESLMFLVNDMQRKSQDTARQNLARSVPSIIKQRRALLDELETLSQQTNMTAEGLRDAMKALVQGHRGSDAQEKPIAQLSREAMVSKGQTLSQLAGSILLLGLETGRDHPLRVALDVIASLVKSRRKGLPNDVPNPFGRVWLSLLKSEYRGLARAAFYGATLILIKRALRNGSAWIPESGSWRAPDKHLIPLRLWGRDSKKFIHDLNLEPNAGAYLNRLEPGLRTALVFLSQTVDDERIAIQDTRFKVPRQPKHHEDPEVQKLRNVLLRRIGSVQFPTVITDMDRELGLSDILLGNEPRSPRERLQIYGAILALGSDLDATQMARMIKGVSIDGVGQMMRRLESGDGIRRANDALVQRLRELDVAQYWGEGIHASSDMMSLDAARGLWSARVDPRRKTPAIGTYTHVLDQWALIYDQPIVLNERQAGVALEGALRKQNRMIERVAVDTHGVTNVSMALAKALGFDICPRFAGLSDRKLYLFPDTPVPENLEPVVSRTLSRRAIAKGWDGFCRLAASTKGGWCSAVWAMRRNGAASVGEPVHRTADQLGKLLRTIYLCDYLTNEGFRVEIEKLLARGEAVHPLQRALHDGAIRHRRGRTLEQLKGVSGALTLLSNIVITWNAIRFDEIITEADFQHELKHMEHIAPVHFRHINLRGIFAFDLGEFNSNSSLVIDMAEKSS